MKGHCRGHISRTDFPRTAAMMTTLITTLTLTLVKIMLHSCGTKALIRLAGLVFAMPRSFNQFSVRRTDKKSVPSEKLALRMCKSATAKVIKHEGLK